MKTKWMQCKSLFSLVFAVTVLMMGVSVQAKNNSPDMMCHSYVVMDASSGKVLFGQDEDKKIYPASTAKLMTAIVCIQQGDINGKIKTKSSVVDHTSPGTFNLGIGAGQTYTFKDLLHMSLMASSADATDSLAVAVFGSKKACAKAMRQKCKALGLSHTSFDNPVGSDIGSGFKHTYSTAREMALITRYVLSNKLIRNICAKRYYEVGDLSFSSTNWFLTGEYRYSKKLYTIIGSKSGTTNAAGHVFIATACDQEGHEIICAYFGDVSKESTFKGIRILLDKTFKQIKSGKIQVAKGNYDVRFDPYLRRIYDKLAKADCLPDHKGNRMEKLEPVTRSQLGTMLRVEKCLKNSNKLDAYVNRHPKAKMRTKDLLALVKYLFPGCIREKASQKEAVQFLAEHKLLREAAAKKPEYIITRKEAMLFVQHLSDYEMEYMGSHVAIGYLKDLGEKKVTDLTVFNDEWMQHLKEQYKKQKIEE